MEGSRVELLAGLRRLGDELPFNRHLGVRVVELEPGLAVTELDADPALHNHLGGVHAVAELAPVELAGALAVTGRLVELLEDGWVPVVGELQARYEAPAGGRLTARAEVPAGAVAPALAAARGGERPKASARVVVTDEEGVVVVEAALTFLFIRPAKDHSADAQAEGPPDV